MASLFISQERLDAWAADGKVVIEGQHMTVTALGRSFSIAPAARFLKVAGDEDDPNDLLNRVKSEEDIVAMGGDLYMNSVIHGDIAYDVQPGFLGIPEPVDGE